MSMSNNIDYQRLYNRVGSLIGWDFSKLQVVRKGEKWRFYDVVVERSPDNSNLLDIGTGGGRRVLKITSNFRSVVGIDLSKNMIQVAKDNLKRSKKRNVRFVVMDAFNLGFSNDFFDIISCRHSPFSSQEIFRVLKPRGIFLTQQVSEGDKLNIKQTFGRGQDFHVKDGSAKRRYVYELRKAGFEKIEVFEYDAKEWYKTPEDLIFLLQNTPIIPEFGKQKEDFVLLSKFIEKYTTDQGILTNSKRYMIIARKP